jgi:predicted aspartyl protease
METKVKSWKFLIQKPSVKYGITLTVGLLGGIALSKLLEPQWVFIPNPDYVPRDSHYDSEETLKEKLTYYNSEEVPPSLENESDNPLQIQIDRANRYMIPAKVGSVNTEFMVDTSSVKPFLTKETARNAGFEIPDEDDVSQCDVSSRDTSSGCILEGVVKEIKIGKVRLKDVEVFIYRNSYYDNSIGTEDLGKIGRITIENYIMRIEQE